MLDWAHSRFVGRLASGNHSRPGDVIQDSKQAVAPEFQTLADLFTAADPQTENQKALVAAYWIQTHEGNGSFSGQAVNSSLTHMGYGVSNITRALSALMERKPKLVIQLEKSGKTKQARKIYKVTLEGERFVRVMLGGTRDDETGS